MRRSGNPTVVHHARRPSCDELRAAEVPCHISLQIQNYRALRQKRRLAQPWAQRGQKSARSACQYPDDRVSFFCRQRIYGVCDDPKVAAVPAPSCVPARSTTDAVRIPSAKRRWTTVLAKPRRTLCPFADPFVRPCALGGRRAGRRSGLAGCRQRYGQTALIISSDSCMLPADPESAFTREIDQYSCAICAPSDRGQQVEGVIYHSCGHPDGDGLGRLHHQDNGPGLPPNAKEKLFTACQGGVRKGGNRAWPCDCWQTLSAVPRRRGFGNCADTGEGRDGF